MDFLLTKAIDFLDSGKPQVGKPIVQFLIHWVNAHNKITDQIDPTVLDRFTQILQIVFKRFAYPDWCELQVEPEEREADYQ